MSGDGSPDGNAPFRHWIHPDGLLFLRTPWTDASVPSHHTLLMRRVGSAWIGDSGDELSGRAVESAVSQVQGH